MTYNEQILRVMVSTSLFVFCEIVTSPPWLWNITDLDTIIAPIITYRPTTVN